MDIRLTSPFIKKILVIIYSDRRRLILRKDNIMMFKIYDERSLEDVLVTGSHDYAGDEYLVHVEGHNLVTSKTLWVDPNVDDPELKKELLEHPERFTLDGKPITEISLHRYVVDTEENGNEICQIEVVLFN